MLIDIPDEFAESIKHQVELEIAASKRHKVLCRQIATDDGLKQAIDQGEFYPTTKMIGRLEDYAKDFWEIPYYRRFNEFRDSLGTKCPVIMAGAKYSLHRKYAKSRNSSHPNGWYELVAERYLRMKKHTSIGWGRKRKRSYEIIQKWVNNKCITWGKFTNPLDASDDLSYINGIPVWTENPERKRVLKSLSKQLHKIDDLEKCLRRIHDL
jgi:hypothetical protein